MAFHKVETAYYIYVLIFFYQLITIIYVNKADLFIY